MAVLDILIRELEDLPQREQENVLSFVRFLKIGLADNQCLRERYHTSLAQVRRIAEERGITEQDIVEEIRAVRSERL
jgi:glutamate mutase epsilon subunit